MTISVPWSASWMTAVVNHLWQSTAAAGIGWLLAFVLRNNQARVRYWVWFAASLKFLLPFSMLVAAGGSLRSLLPTIAAAQPAVAGMAGQVMQPFAQTQLFDTTELSVSSHRAHWVPFLLLSIWACGVLIVAGRIARGWWRVYRNARSASPLDLEASVPVLSCRTRIEPGIFGIFRPALLLPDGILDRLSENQLKAILAHEMCHVRRRDNLTYALHMMVETLFWFHPAVWWIGAKLMEDRELACDEAVVQAGGNAQDYAEGILNVCKFYIESPVACVAGVTGADLKKRIAHIIAGEWSFRLSWPKRFFVGVLALATLAMPMALGLANLPQFRAQLLFAKDNLPSFEVATIKPSRTDGGHMNFGLTATRFTVVNASTSQLIRFAYDVKSDDQVMKGPEWTNSEKFDIDAKIGDAQVEAMKKLTPDQRFDQYRLMVQSLLADRFKVKVSTTSKELPVYALVIAKDGPKLPPASATSGTKSGHMPMLYGGSSGDLNASGITMKFFTDFFLSGRSDLGGRMVIDATGLEGSYDFTLKFSPADMSASPPNGTDAAGATTSMTSDSSPPSLFTALQEQLGLKLERRKAPVEVLVIDSVEQPSAN